MPKSYFLLTVAERLCTFLSHTQTIVFWFFWLWKIIFKKCSEIILIEPKLSVLYINSIFKFSYYSDYVTKTIYLWLLIICCISPNKYTTVFVPFSVCCQERWGQLAGMNGNKQKNFVCLCVFWQSQFFFEACHNCYVILLSHMTLLFDWQSLQIILYFLKTQNLNFNVTFLYSTIWMTWGKTLK